MDEREARSDALKAFTARVGICIGNEELYDRALTHASRVAEAREPKLDYESLEFLGDAVLGLAVAHHLFQVVPDRSPGEYTRLRAGLVNRACLARVARQLDIAPVILLGKGEERSGGRQRAALNADCLEAFIGAVYLDHGWDTALDFVVRIFKQEIVRARSADNAWDFKSRLQNYCQAERIPLPEFTVIRSEGPDHKKEFEIEVSLRGAPAGRGKGSTKKEAEQKAARKALESEGLTFP